MSNPRDPRLFAALGDVLGALGEASLAELLAASEHGRRALLKQERYATIDLSTRLLTRCRAAWLAGEPAQGIELAKLAALVAERIGTDVASEREIATTRSLAARHLTISVRLARTPIVPVVSRTRDLSWVAEGQGDEAASSFKRLEQALLEVASAASASGSALEAEVAEELRWLRAGSR